MTPSGPHSEQDHSGGPAEEPSEECESWDGDYEEAEQGRPASQPAGAQA